MADADEPGRKLKRSLSTWDLMIMGVAVAVGAGIFSVGAKAAANFSGPAVTLSFASLALALSVILAGGTYLAARGYLIEQREQTAAQQAFARSMIRRLRSRSATRSGSSPSGATLDTSTEFGKRWCTRSPSPSASAGDRRSRLLKT